MKTALLLIAHGSRQAEANADLHYVAEELRKRGDYALVAVAFLELAEPDIVTAGQACVAEGVERVVLLPYFLSAGVHVRRDLQDYHKRLAKEHPRVKFLLGEPLGRHPLLVELAALRAREAAGA